MNLAFKNANILLPKHSIDHTKWSVVACDQHTSEPQYWDEVERLVGDEPSTYNLILPEVYLGDADVEARLAKISGIMKEYLVGDVFDEHKDAMIYVERTDSEGNVRAGIVGAIDLEEYDYNQGSKSQVRATESTVLSRIPPRVKVRESAEIELPHIMILINDEKKIVIEPLAKKDMQLVYDFDLMQGGGHLKGWLIDSETQEEILAALNKLGEGAPDNLLFAMGDGNHSLATAKKFFEDLKAAHPSKDLSNHPARYALAEIVNLHSPALKFEAIHRIVEDVDVQQLVEQMKEELGLEEISLESFNKNLEAKNSNNQSSQAQEFKAIINGTATAYKITNPSSNLTVGSLQNFLDSYIEKHEGGIDYIHGEEVVSNLAKKPNAIGFILPDMKKEELYPTVISDGALPRKTFSMGHAEDKRFYMECRKIK